MVRHPPLERLLKSRGIDLGFDVGANVGEYARQLRSIGYRSGYNFARSIYFALVRRWEPLIWKAGGVDYLDPRKAEAFLEEGLRGTAPFAAVKIGATELAVLRWMAGGRMTTRRAQTVFDLSGIFPADRDFYRRYFSAFGKALFYADLLGLWHGKGEYGVYRRHDMTARATPFTSVTGRWEEILKRKTASWFRALKDQTILVVSPFAEVMAERAGEKSWDGYWGDRLPWPGWRAVLPAVFPYGFEPETQQRYGDALTLLRIFKEENEQKLREADVLLGGCGPYAVPLAAWAKQLGKKAVVMGGDLQLLFGIKGGRWDGKRGIWRSLYNNWWIRPPTWTVPANAHRVENACYW